MTLAFIALKPSRRFIARITNFKVFVFFKVFLFLLFGMFHTVVVLMEKKLSHEFCFAYKAFK